MIWNKRSARLIGFLVQKQRLAHADSMLAAGESYKQTTPERKGNHP
jgi:hypothetical protein